MRRTLFGTVSVALTLVVASASAQQPGYGQPPPQGAPPPGYGQPPPQGYGQQGPYGQPQSGYPPAAPTYAGEARPAPPPLEYVEPERPTHAPKFSLWVGPRLSYMGFGFSFFQNGAGENETTGNFVGNGVGAQADIGARISYRYIPYLFYEHGFMGQGHRFEGSNATSSTSFYGIGFRYVSGDVDSVGFMTDLSIGKRVIRVSNGSETYEMSGLEIFKLGLGAEIRVATLFTIEPMLAVSGGSLNDTEGSIKYSPEGSRDGRLGPDYQNGQVIKTSTAYVNLSLGVGVHFDVFGK